MRLWALIRRGSWLLAAICVAGAAFAPEASAVPAGFNVQGRLTDANGVNRSGSYSIKFSLFDALTGGNLMWSNTFPLVPVKNGNFQVVLGDVQGQPTMMDVFAGGSRFLEIQVLAGPGVPTPEPPMVPRQQLVSVPYALFAGTAAAIVATGPVALPDLSVSGNIGVGTTQPSQRLDVQGNINLTGNIYANGVKGMVIGGFFTSQGGAYSSGAVNPLTGGYNCPLGFNTSLLFATGGFGSCSGTCSSLAAYICWR